MHNGEGHGEGEDEGRGEDEGVGMVDGFPEHPSQTDRWRGSGTGMNFCCSLQKVPRRGEGVGGDATGRVAEAWIKGFLHTAGRGAMVTAANEPRGKDGGAGQLLRNRRRAAHGGHGGKAGVVEQAGSHQQGMVRSSSGAGGGRPVVGRPLIVDLGTRTRQRGTYRVLLGPAI